MDVGSGATALSWDVEWQLSIAKASVSQSGSVDMRLFMGQCQLLNKWEYCSLWVNVSSSLTVDAVLPLKPGT